MQLLTPIWLWGLLGLSIPITVHLLSRKEGRIVNIGSIRHLDDTATRQFKSIRLNEYLLLLLRCILITLLVLLLSGLIFSSLQKKENWLLIDRGLETEKEFSGVIDSLRKSGYQIKSLTSGFPELSDSFPHPHKVNYWSILTELATQPVQQVVVFSYNYFEGFKGRRI